MTPRYGLLFSTQMPPGQSAIEDLWVEILDRAEQADRLGFHSLHLPEHHMREDGYLPQPLVAAAAIAMRTRRVLIGPTVLVAPLRHPVHLAEEAAMVDVLSNGRLVLGLGIGNFRPEFELFGVPLEDQAAIFEETISVLLAAWSGDPVVHDGSHFRFDGQIVRPLPVQRPRPPVWIGGMSNPGVRRAGRFGLPLILDPLHPIDQLERWVARYREECAAHGHEAEVILIRYGWLGSPAALEAEWWPHLRETVWTYLKQVPRIRADVDPRIAACSSIDELQFGWVEPERFLVGTAEEVRAKAASWAERLGADHVVVKLQGATGPWGAELERMVDEWGRLVIGGGDDTGPTDERR